ncbi:MAG: DUF4279 domain-containing protein [Hyphomicrobium sp.]
MASFSVYVSIRLQGDELIPNQLTELLGCCPTRAWAKGDLKDVSNRQILAKSGLWRLSSEKTACTLDAQVSALYKQLDTRSVKTLIDVPGVTDAKLDVLVLKQATNLNSEVSVSLNRESITRIKELGIEMMMTFGCLDYSDARYL